MKRKSAIRIFAGSAVLFLAACSSSKSSSGSSTSQEKPYCNQTFSYSTFHTITGHAQYERRLHTVCGLGDIDPTTYPIRYAEIQIFDHTGSLVQCAETDGSGNFSFKVPDDNQTYSIAINSRSYNALNKTSVLKDPVSNEPYSLTTNFISDADKSLATLTATANEAGDFNIPGGAFNILDNTFKANDFLTNHSGGSFNVTAKLRAYWKRGINPVTYFGGNPSQGVSFYVPGSNNLYILGGIDGDISVNDTDHFDDSIILHEFGHFVEDNYSVSSSPGGTHYGRYIIDPRLAWSEGFATFFQAAVLGQPFYQDTFGHDNSTAATLVSSCGASTGYFFDYNIETNVSAMDVPTTLGEGNFREFAITRFLWDAIDSASGEAGDAIQIDFTDLFNVYTSGFKNGEHFQDMGLFLREQALVGPNISSLYSKSDALMRASRADFAASDNPATIKNPASPSCQYTIQAQDNASDWKENGSFAKSNQFASNDFYYLQHPGGPLSVNLSYVVSGNADLDLYVYKDNYTYGSASSLLSYSARPSMGSPSLDNGLENINVFAPAGIYMVNVQYYTGNPRNGSGAPFSSTTYTIKINGSLICH